VAQVAQVVHPGPGGSGGPAGTVANCLLQTAN